MMIITEDHGGYKAGMCIVCKQSGWIDQIKHKGGCPIDEKGSYVEINTVKFAQRH
jgi:hypothetical protein